MFEIGNSLLKLINKKLLKQPTVVNLATIIIMIVAISNFISVKNNNRQCARV